MSGRASLEERRAHDRFVARRRLRRRRFGIVAGILGIAALAALLYGLWQRPVRISSVTIYGADQSLSELAREAMSGTLFGIVPADSTFFAPIGRIRARLMAAHPDIAAVSIFRDGFTGLSIKVDERMPVARWCGLAPGAGAPSCYFFDANGFLYATATPAVAPVNDFLLYGPLASPQAPIGTTLASAGELPATFDFARQLAALGSPVVTVTVGSDNEVDDVLRSGTLVRYVLGSENQAFAALSAARADLNLADGSLEYVDLRFSGSVYFKKK